MGKPPSCAYASYIKHSHGNPSSDQLPLNPLPPKPISPCTPTSSSSSSVSSPRPSNSKYENPFVDASPSSASPPTTASLPSPCESPPLQEQILPPPVTTDINPPPARTRRRHRFVNPLTSDEPTVKHLVAACGLVVMLFAVGYVIVGIVGSLVGTSEVRDNWGPGKDSCRLAAEICGWVLVCVVAIWMVARFWKLDA